MTGGSPAAAERYDVGFADGADFTVREIARMIGRPVATINGRVRAGLRGAELLIPRRCGAPATDTSSVEKLLRRSCVEDAVSGCWVWSGSHDVDGYGRVGIRGGSRKAHRLSYETFIGPIPSGGCVCHRCDNPPCIRPDHLFVGTNRENIADRTRKGRDAHAESSGMARLTSALVAELRASSESTAAWARRHNVSVSASGSARRGITWKSVSAPSRDRQVSRVSAAVIDAVRSSTESAGVLGKRFGISKTHVGRIRSGWTPSDGT